MGTYQCCICLDKKNPVQNVTEVDESNVKISEKLQYIAPEVVYFLDLCTLLFLLILYFLGMVRRIPNMSELHKRVK